MKDLIGGESVMPGFRFHPTDEELIRYYLKRKVLGKTQKTKVIAEVEVYRYPPWELPALSCLKTGDLVWYFLCPRAKNYPNSGKPNRANEYGYWKTTGKDRNVVSESRVIGKIKTLIFHGGKAPKGERTNWVIHEYSLEEWVVARQGVAKDSYVLCKVYEKSGIGSRNGEDYGAPFVEAKWESDDDGDGDGDHVQEGSASGLALHELDRGCVGCSADGSDSALTSVEGVSADNNNTIGPSVGSDSSLISGRGICVDNNVVATNVGSDYNFAIAAANRGSSETAPASVVASTGFSDSTPTVSLPTVSAAFMGTDIVTTASVVSNAVFAADNDEITRMLSYFTENHVEKNIFNDWPHNHAENNFNDWDWPCL